MSFPVAIRTCLHKYADFHGRAQAAEFWWFALGFAVVAVAGQILDAVLGTQRGGYGLFGAVAVLGLLLPLLAAGSRRLQDTGRSGWWLLLALVPCGGLVLIGLWADQSKGDNAWGPAPGALSVHPDLG